MGSLLTGLNLEDGKMLNVFHESLKKELIWDNASGIPSGNVRFPVIIFFQKNTGLFFKENVL